MQLVSVIRVTKKCFLLVHRENHLSMDGKEIPGRELRDSWAKVRHFQMHH